MKMFKAHRKNDLIAFVIFVIALFDTVNDIVALTVDNQLVSARNDCFERIALEAMLPFEKTFRTEDTNSLKMCKEKCLRAGDKCQSLSFGVHRRGNGTCQLSKEKYGSSGGRPSGIIFDPDFDLYSRKTNCFDLTDNTIPPSDATDGAGGSSSSSGSSGGYGFNFSPTPTVHLPNRPSDGTPTLLVNPTPSTTTSYSQRPSTPPGSYGYGTTLYASPSPGPGSTPLSGTTDGDRLYFTHDVYPLYKYPTLYEHNYPAPPDDVYIPGGYASNVPEVNVHYRPGYSYGDQTPRPTPSGPPRPMFGLGYGNGYSYGKPERFTPTTPRPYDQTTQYDRDPDRNRPSYTYRPGYYGSGSSSSNDRPVDRPGDRPMGPNDRPSRPDYGYSSPPPYYPRPEYGQSRPPSQDSRPPQPTSGGSQRPGDYYDYTYRPDPPQDSGHGSGPSTRPPIRDSAPSQGGYGDASGYNNVRRNGTAARPDGGYNDDKQINTYFNPEDYMNRGGNKKRPGIFSDRDRNPAGYPMDEMKGRTFA